MPQDVGYDFRQMPRETQLAAARQYLGSRATPEALSMVINNASVDPSVGQAVMRLAASLPQPDQSVPIDAMIDEGDGVATSAPQETESAPSRQASSPSVGSAPSQAVQPASQPQQQVQSPPPDVPPASVTPLPVDPRTGQPIDVPPGPGQDDVPAVPTGPFQGRSPDDDSMLGSIIDAVSQYSIPGMLYNAVQAGASALNSSPSAPVQSTVGAFNQQQPADTGSNTHQREDIGFKEMLQRTIQNVGRGADYTVGQYEQNPPQATIRTPR